MTYEGYLMDLEIQEGVGCKQDQEFLNSVCRDKFRWGQIIREAIIRDTSPVRDVSNQFPHQPGNEISLILDTAIITLWEPDLIVDLLLDIIHEHDEFIKKYNHLFPGENGSQWLHSELELKLNDSWLQENGYVDMWSCITGIEIEEE